METKKRICANGRLNIRILVSAYLLFYSVCFNFKDGETKNKKQPNKSTKMESKKRACANGRLKISILGQCLTLIIFCVF